MKCSSCNVCSYCTLRLQPTVHKVTFEKKADAFPHCSRCKSVENCSKACEKDHWKLHCASRSFEQAIIMGRPILNVGIGASKERASDIRNFGGL